MSAQLRELRALRELSMVADRVSGQDHLPLTDTRLTWAEASLVAFLPRQVRPRGMLQMPFEGRQQGGTRGACPSLHCKLL